MLAPTRLMNARPQNTLAADLPVRPFPGGDGSSAPELSRRDPLQSLLAFAALTQQIRERNVRFGNPNSPLSYEFADAEQRLAFDQVLQLAAERAMVITRADGVAIAIADGQSVVCRASVGKTAPDIGARLNPSSGFSGACLTSGTAVRCDDSNHDPRVNPYICRQLGSRSMVAVPLLVKRTTIGLIETFSSVPHHFTDSDVRRLALLAELILAAMQPREEVRLEESSPQLASRTLAVNPALSTPVESGQVAQSAARSTEIEAGELPVEPVYPRFFPEPLESDIAAEPASEIQFINPPSQGRWVVLAALALIVAVAGCGWWFTHRRTGSSSAASTQLPAISSPASSTNASTPPAETNVPAVASVHHASGITDITGIRHWSSQGSSTIAIDLGDQVQYEAHHLNDPERIYLDLHDTKLDPKLSHPIEVGDALLTRVRAAQGSDDITRIVLETRSAVTFAVSIEQNPYRLVVEIHGAESRPQPRAKVDLFGPSKSPFNGTAQTSDQSSDVKPSKSPKLRIVLDAGHGGWDLGTVGRQGLLEKDLTLDLVSRLGQLVAKRLGAEVVYTRADDTYIALEKRTEVANVDHADLFVSVHANYSDFTSARGVETYYTNTYSSAHAHTPDGDLQNVNWTNVNIREKVDDSRRLAGDVQQSLYRALAAKSELPNRGVKEASYIVLTGTTMPAILTEVSFVSSPTDETNLKSSTYRQEIAEAIYQGVARYTEATRHVTLAHSNSSTKPIAAKSTTP